MRFTKWMSPFLLTIIIVMGLGACDSSLEKPTGLEDNHGEVAKTVNKNNVHEAQEDKEINKDKEALKKEDAKKADGDKDKKENNKANLVDSEKDNDHPTKDKRVVNRSDSTTDSSALTIEKRTASGNLNKAPAKSSTKNNDSSNAQRSNSESTIKKEKPVSKQNTKKPVEKEKSKAKPKPAKDTITHSIVISSTEIPLPPTKMEINEGDTVLQALINITRANKIQMDYRGGQGATAYVQGMANVYEFDRGQGSGWMYRINGIFPDRGAGVVPVCDGDKVEWVYTTNLGEDLGADLKPVRRDGKCNH